ncbi:MAG: aldehyde dehydrogenase family protein, partial [Phycisphaerales bacterium JB043]
MSSDLIEHLVGGHPLKSDTGNSHPVINPASDSPLARTPLDDVSAVDAAVKAASEAFPQWAATPVGDRIQHLFRYKQILEEKASDLADIVVEEHGKTKAEALGSVRRGIDCVEHACAAPLLMMGRTLPQIAVSSSFCRTEDEGGVGIDSALDRVPLGVCAGITPFNFPVMVPMWMWPMAIACGNTFVLKPSERDPLSAIRSIELAHEAGIPDGVLNVVHGGADVVNHLLAHNDIRAISFVGSTRAGHHIYSTAAANGKRVQCMCGAKNYSIIMPDANQEAAIDGVLGSAFGNTGQRCLAGSVVVCVGDAADWFIPGLIKAAEQIKVGPGNEADTTMGPLQDKDALDRVKRYIDTGASEGAILALDGRTTTHPQNACFIGPTIFDNVTPDMAIAREEIFGPVLSILKFDSEDEAVEIANDTPYGLTNYVQTQDGERANRMARRLRSGMVEMNGQSRSAGAPFGGMKQSGNGREGGTWGIEDFLEV